ncbi:MAG: sugar-binding domain-containing protein [Planctomycetaceae bacterium]
MGPDCLAGKRVLHRLWGGTSRPAGGNLVTRWGREVNPERVWPEYPRPQMQRSRWLNLNGTWEYAITSRETNPLTTPVDGPIVVPFPVESHLSGVRRTVGNDRQLVYRRKFDVPAGWKTQRVLLHFGAVDWQTTVWVNGQRVGEHRGGYDPFRFDITRALAGREGAHELVVQVWDPSDAGTQPRGKQQARPEGIWYTPVTGIWQTVWLEPVPTQSIERLEVTPRFDTSELQVRAIPRQTEMPSDLKVRLSANGGVWQTAGPLDSLLILDVPGFEAWSPTTPRLYDLVVEVWKGEELLDRVESYFGMRKIALGKDRNGMTRMLLNNEPVFQFGPLDQGWWPDGLYTAPSDAALKSDLEVTRQLGFNLVRKHVKVEPARWYYHCDTLGLLVWQDMPSGDANARWPWDGTENPRTPEASQQFEQELSTLLTQRGNDTCLVAWVPFNEAWGQFETVRWTGFVEQRDPHRLVISASGGNDFGVGHIRDIHFYPQPEFPPAELHRAAVLGEYGGLGLPLPGHTWHDQRSWGYRQFQTREQLQEVYLRYITALRPMVESHLSAAIYTQTSDVEIEVNGLLTYDREVLKLDPARIHAAHQALYAPLRELASEEVTQASVIAHWRFEEGQPGELVPHDRGKPEGLAVRDDSGHRNHLYAYAEGNAPRLTAKVPAPTVPFRKLSNRGALDDSLAAPGVTRDLYTDPGRSRTHMDMLTTFPFTGMTLELSFQPVGMGREQTLVGEDGQPTAAPEAPLQLGLRADNRLEMAVIDRSGTVRRVIARQAVSDTGWQHVVATMDGETLTLWRNSGEGWQQEGTTPCPGGLVLHDGTWTVGRGFHAGKLARDAQALIDEVRISTRSLRRDEWLWNTP